MERPEVTVDPDAKAGEGDLASFGPQRMPFLMPGGEVRLANCLPACNFGVNLMVGAEGMVAVMALAIDGPAGLHGIYAPFSADELRANASQLLILADRIDGGRGKQ